MQKTKIIRLIRLFLAILITSILAVSCSNSPNIRNKPKVKHVVVIGFDGLSPDGIRNANTPTFDRIIKEGAHSFHARAVLPTSSSSNWASMIMGAGPEQHGITSNSWEKDNFTLPAVTQKEDFLFPTIFTLINDQVPDAKIGAIYNWKGFGRLFEKNAVDYDISAKTEEETATLAAKYIKENKPTFTFIHFDHIDHAGHNYGHGTDHYYESVEKGDQVLAQVMQAIEEAGMNDDTMVIVTADHGGLGKGHGGSSLMEAEIPFILWGKPIRKDFLIEHPIYQYDNAATVAYALGVRTPHAWIGKPAFMAFNDNTTFYDNYKVNAMEKSPVIVPEVGFSKRAGGLFNDSAELNFKSNENEMDIHFTTDGSMPSAKSAKFEMPILIDKNTTVKAAYVKNGSLKSTVTEGYFRIKPSNYQAPVKYELYYLKNLTNVPNLNNRKANAIGYIFEITSDEIKEEIKSNTAVRFTTKINIEKEDNYRFTLRSDDGSKLWINNEEVVDNDGDHGILEKSGSISLKSGVYDLKVVLINVGGGAWLDVYYKSSSEPKQILRTTMLSTN